MLATASVLPAEKRSLPAKPTRWPSSLDADGRARRPSNAHKPKPSAQAYLEGHFKEKELAQPLRTVLSHIEALRAAVSDLNADQAAHVAGELSQLYESYRASAGEGAAELRGPGRAAGVEAEARDVTGATEHSSATKLLNGVIDRRRSARAASLAAAAGEAAAGEAEAAGEAASLDAPFLDAAKLAEAGAGAEAYRRLSEPRGVAARDCVMRKAVFTPKLSTKLEASEAEEQAGATLEELGLPTQTLIISD